MLPHFRDVACFLHKTATPPISQAKFGVAPLGLDCHFEALTIEDSRLIRVITLN